MTEETGQTTADRLPHLPETQVIEPVVQCGVLYLGSASPSPGRRGLDSIQEPFAHRYPVDGTNTVRGIDAVLSVYENGIQVTFARQPHAVIFYPLSSLIYCASVRFSIVENDQTSSIDWRFVTLDSTVNYSSKHPPLFCAVVQRTRIFPGDECHCFITKSDDAALALVRTISEVYASLSPNTRPLKSPVFYQLDRYGRKISETTGVIYLSPATDDESQLNRITDHSASIPSINRNCLLDPSLDGFFYRTDGNIIEQWQLWDDDVTGSRPRPPPSPFGQHQALYHDDLTPEIHQYLRRMEDEEYSGSCSCSSSSNSSEQFNHRHRRRRQKSKYDNADQSNRSHTSSFDPTLPFAQNNNTDPKRTQHAPIIIEKVIPKNTLTVPQKLPTYMMPQSQQLSYTHSVPVQETTANYTPYSEAYQINDRGEKITNEGNRILYMDVIQPNVINNQIESTSYATQPVHHTHPHQRQRRRRRPPKPIPIIDLQSVEQLFHEKKSQQRRTSTDHESGRDNFPEQKMTTSDMLEIVEGYFEDYKGRKIQLDGQDAQSMLGHLESTSRNDRRGSKSSEQKTYRRRQKHSTINAGPSINYVERSAIKSPIEKQQEPPPPTSVNTDRVSEYISSIYGAPEHTSETTSHHETESATNPTTAAMTEQEFISPFRYMQSSINPLLLREYRHVFTGIQ